MVLTVVVLLIMNNGGSVADVIGGDERSDGRVKNCCCDNKIASTLDRLFLFFKCRPFFFLFFFSGCVPKWGHGPRGS